MSKQYNQHGRALINVLNAAVSPPPGPRGTLDILKTRTRQIVQTRGLGVSEGHLPRNLFPVVPRLLPVSLSRPAQPGPVVATNATHGQRPGKGTQQHEHPVSYGNTQGERHPGHALSTGEYGTHAAPVWYWIYLDGIGIITTFIKKIYVYELHGATFIATLQSESYDNCVEHVHYLTMYGYLALKSGLVSRQLYFYYIKLLYDI